MAEKAHLMDVKTQSAERMAQSEKSEGREAIGEGREAEYDEELHGRFCRWMEQSGASLAKAAKMVNRSTALLSQYQNKIYPGNIEEIEKDIASLLRREDDLELTLKPAAFVKTRASVFIWEVLQYCDIRQRMGVVIAPSGSGKTSTALEYQRDNRATMLITSKAVTYTRGSTMRLMAKHILGGRPKISSIDDIYDKIVDRLIGSRRLLIIDDAHFVPWIGLEIIRQLHDDAGVGVVYLGQEDLYNQMTGKTDKAKLFDQIYSRIAIKRDRVRTEREDVKLLVESLYPCSLGKLEMDYLAARGKEKGHLRKIAHLIEMFASVRQNNPGMTDMEALGAAEEFLLQKETGKR